MRYFFFTNQQTDDSYISENITEIVNTDIGYNQEELDAQTTDDLLVLRRAIFAYLKSPTLKKRNPNYLKLFKRINVEIKKRKILEDEKLDKKSEIGNKFLFGSFDSDTSDRLKFLQKNFNKEKENKIDLLKLKRKNDLQNINLQKKQNNLSIPDFLQDKNKRKGAIDLSNILDDKIEALKSFNYEKESGKKNCVSTRVKEFMLEDHDENFVNFKCEKMNMIDKELKDVQMSLILMDTVENDPDFNLY